MRKVLLLKKKRYGRGFGRVLLCKILHDIDFDNHDEIGINDRQESYMYSSVQQL